MPAPTSSATSKPFPNPPGFGYTAAQTPRRDWKRVKEVWPIRIEAGAFGSGVPRAAPRVSPDHVIYTDGLLIPAKLLVNGATITQEPCEAIDYYHVELDEHDVLLTEGLAAESYLDAGNRSAFRQRGRLHDAASRVRATQRHRCLRTLPF